MKLFTYLLIAAVATIAACQSQLGFSCVTVDVTSMKISDITSTTAMLSWKGVDHATSYVIHIHEKADTAGLAFKDFEVQQTTTFKLYNLKANTRYEYTLETICGSSGLNNSGYAKPFQEFTTTP